jgi:hypothetical protein
MDGVQPEIAHAAVLAVELRLPLPVDRLARVEVARVQEERAHLQHPAEPPLGDPARDLLPTREERELRGAADEQLRMGRDRLVDPLVRAQVDSERLLAQQMLPRVQAGDVHLLVEVVRDRNVDGLHGVVCQQLAIVRDQARRRPEPFVPREDRRVHIAHGDDLRAGVEVGQVQPARCRARRLAPH